MAKQSAELELARMKINVDIEAAASEAEVANILNKIGLDLKMFA